MNKVEFDGRLLEGKNVQKKILDIAYEMDFSGDEQDFLYTLPKKTYHYKKKHFIHEKYN